MLAGIFAYLTSGIGVVVTFFGSLFALGIGIFWDSVGAELTETGELVLMAALIGLGLTAISWAFKLIPFVKR